MKNNKHLRRDLIMKYRTLFNNTRSIQQEICQDKNSVSIIQSVTSYTISAQFSANQIMKAHICASMEKVVFIPD